MKVLLSILSAIGFIVAFGIVGTLDTAVQLQNENQLYAALIIAIIVFVAGFMGVYHLDTTDKKHKTEIKKYLVKKNKAA